MKIILFSVLGLIAAGVLIFGVILSVNTYLSNPGDLDEFLRRKFDKLGVTGMDVYDPLYTIDSGGGDSPISLAEFCGNYLAEDGDYYDRKQNFSGERPGSVRLYSNCGFGLLGYLVEVVSKQPFSDYCREHIFVPLGMKNTAWLLSELDETKIAKPYNGKGDALPHYSFPTYPDGGAQNKSCGLFKIR